MKHLTSTNFLLVLFLSLSLQNLSAQVIGNPPGWNWLRQIGGSGGDQINDIVSNAQGDVFVVGTFNGTMQLGASSLQSTGLNEGFVARFNAAGVLQWVQKLAADQPEGEVFGQNIALDGSGNPVVSGAFKNCQLITNDPYGGGAAQNLFAAKLAANGQFLWTEVLTQPGSSIENSVKLVADNSGNIYCRSTFRTFKLSASGTIIWELFDDFFNATIQWKNDTLYLAGSFFNTLSIGIQFIQVNEAAIALVKINPVTGFPSLPEVVAESPVGTYTLSVNTLHVVATDEIYVGGQYTVDLTSGSCDASDASFAQNSFLMRTSPNGCAWIQSQTDTPSELNRILSVTTDHTGAVWVAGERFGPISWGGSSLSGTGNFLSKLDPTTGAVSMLLDNPGGRILTTHPSGFLAAGLSAKGAWWSRLNGNGAETQRLEWDSDSGSGRVCALEVDDSGIYLTANVSGKIDLGGTSTFLPVGSLLISKRNHDGSQELWRQVIPGVSTEFVYPKKAVLDKVHGKLICLGYFFADFSFNGQTYPYLLPDNGFGNDVIVKLDAATGAVEWVRTFNGSKHTESIAVDQEGNILLSGTFSFDMTLGATTLVEKGNDDFFLAKLDPSGNVLWAQRGGGDDIEYLAMVGVDAQNNIYLTSESHSLDIDFNDADLLQTAEGDGNILLAKFSPAGNLIWAKIHGRVDDSNDEAGCFPGGFAVDPAGNTYLSGFSSRTANIGATSLASPYSLNQFYAKFNPNGNALWANVVKTRRFGLNFGELDVDAAGNLYVGAQFRDTIFFGNTKIVAVGSAIVRNAYYARFNGATGALDWATFISGSAEVNVNPAAMAVYNANSILVGGTVTDIAAFGSIVANSYSANNGYLGLLGQDIMVSTFQPKPGSLALTVFPNPASSFVQWKAPEALPDAMQGALLNAGGQVVWQGKFSENTATGRIELEGLPAGLYYLHLLSGGKQTLQQVVVE